MNNTFVPAPPLVPARHAATAWTLAKIGGVFAAVLGLIVSLVLIVAAFASGVVIESTAAAEARAQVANVALGNAFGLTCLAVIAGAAAIAGACARGRGRWLIVPSLLLSAGIFVMGAAVSHDVGRAQCMLKNSEVTAC